MNLVLAGRDRRPGRWFGPNERRAPAGSRSTRSRGGHRKARRDGEIGTGDGGSRCPNLRIREIAGCTGWNPAALTGSIGKSKLKCRRRHFSNASRGKSRHARFSQASYAAQPGHVRAHDRAGAFKWHSAGPERHHRISEIYSHPPATAFLCAAGALHLATAAQAGLRHEYSSGGYLLGAATHFGIEGGIAIGRLI